MKETKWNKIHFMEKRTLENIKEKKEPIFQTESYFFEIKTKNREERNYWSELS